MAEPSRRDFLKLASHGVLAAGGMLGFGMLVRFLGHHSGASRQTIFDLGLASEVPPGTRVLFPEIPAMLIHDDAGFTAISLVCTHLGCTLEINSDGFACPCHNSRYDRQGTVLQGPAVKALPTFLVEQDEDGHLIVSLND